jgi:hypothetical protein
MLLCRSNVAYHVQFGCTFPITANSAYLSTGFTKLPVPLSSPLQNECQVCLIGGLTLSSKHRERPALRRTKYAHPATRLPSNLNITMPIEVSRMTEADIDGAIDTIQQAFAEDPYNNWVFPDREKVGTSAILYTVPHVPTQARSH